MIFREFFDRLRYRIEDSLHAKKISSRLVARLTMLGLFAAFVTAIAPTLADELASDPSMAEPTIMVETTTVTTETPSPSATPVEVVEIEPSASPSSTAEPDVEALETQPRYEIKAPRNSAVDPRATKFFLPALQISVVGSSPKYTMACVRGNGIGVDIGAKNSIEDGDFVLGDRTMNLNFVTQTSQIASLLNAEGGALLFSNGTSIAGRSFSISLVAVSKAEIDPSLCGSARSSAQVAIRALGLELSTVKGAGKLK